LLEELKILRINRNGLNKENTVEVGTAKGTMQRQEGKTIRVRETDFRGKMKCSTLDLF
jgi:hypothetical protein